MATGLLRIHVRSTGHGGDPLISFPHPRDRLSSFRLPTYQRRRQYGVIFFPRTGEHYQKPRAVTFPVNSSISSSNPPSSKDEAVLQAKICLSTTLEKPLNNPKLAGKLKKLRQPRFRVEIPVIDDSPDSLAELAREVFQDLPIKRKGSPVQILLLWPSTEFAKKAIKSLPSTQIEHMDLSRILDDGDTRAFGPGDVAVVMAPESSQLGVVRTVTEKLYPKPVVLFNPRWAFEDEESFGELSSFLGTFEVIYSFMGLEVKGILSKRKGVVFKCVRDGVLSGERWSVHVEEEGGELRVVSRFKSRPSIGEVENVLYNLMAINSPITKSAKFLKDLVSNVTGKK